LESADLERLRKRVRAARHEQYRPKRLKILEDPITGRITLLNPNRVSRHTELIGRRGAMKKGRKDCYYCKGETTSTLFYVDDSLRVVIPDESRSMNASRDFLRTRSSLSIDAYYEMVKHISSFTLPPGRWLTRTFLNLVPPMTTYPEMSFVTAVSPGHHYRQMHELPLNVLTATVISWQVIERLVFDSPLQVVPFINGGKRPESGQSIYCFHSQAYLSRKPPLYERIGQRRSRNGCGVCSILRKKALTVYSNGDWRVLAHPAPVRNHSLLIAPANCLPRLFDVDPVLFAEAIKASLEATALFTGSVPAYNVAVRCGQSVGHLHAEFIPKTETNLPAGFEEATDMTVITEPPLKVAAQLRRLLS
jgi:diadenosine tetraphosphate (Ap4A) HIT family hydrolase